MGINTGHLMHTGYTLRIGVILVSTPAALFFGHVMISYVILFHLFFLNCAGLSSR